MAQPSPERLRAVRKFEDLVRYLEDELGWPLDGHTLDDGLTFEYSADELGLKELPRADEIRIRQLRPLQTGQPWGIFFVEFPRKRLPVLVLRRILNALVVKKRTSSGKSKQAAWNSKDLLFISAFGDEAGGERELAFAHFHEENGDKPVLRVLDWDGGDTPLKLARLDDTLKRKLAWVQDGESLNQWRERWSSAFRLRLNHVIRTSSLMADVLAKFGQGIRQRVLTGLAHETDKGPLHVILEEFRTSLLHDLTERDFADTYAQTVTYGLLSLAITKTQAGQAKTLTAAHLVSEVPLTSPFLREILGELLKRGGRKGGLDYDELGLHDVVEFLNSDDTDLPAILADFGNKSAADDPVIHFYEHFLKAYDKELKVQRGVFYTPRPVVSYIVRSVHEILQSEFGLVDGLADTSTWGQMAEAHPKLKIPEGMKPSDRFVTILDPATGTATFLVEVIDVIHRTLLKKWQEQGHHALKCVDLWNAYVPQHLLPRLHGYELLMAPYAIAHLKIGLKLAETGYTFGSPAVARLFLTNALEPPTERKLAGLGLMALAHEAEAVNVVKRHARFTVILGNPPYSNFGQLNKIPSILEPLQDYKKGLKERKINLDDDFIKFVRFSQDLIGRSGTGALGMITNNVFFGGLTHRRMRESLLETFQSISVVDLHGNSVAHERAPDGASDDNVFEIRQGVGISLMRRLPGAAATRQTTFAEILGSRALKYRLLSEPSAIRFAPVRAAAPRFSLLKEASEAGDYAVFVSLQDVFSDVSYGIQTKRDSLTVAFTKDELLERVRFLTSHSESAIRKHFDLPEDGRDWTIEWARKDLARLADASTYARRVLYRPFDYRWTIYTDRSKGFLAYPRWGTMRCMLEDNLGLIAMRQVFQDVPSYSHFGVTKTLIDERTFYSNRGGTYLFPLYRLAAAGQRLFAHDARLSNINPAFARSIAEALGHGSASPEEVFSYIYAVLSSPAYRARYKDALKVDFPRVPVPGGRELFRELASLGSELAEVQLLESPLVERLTTSFVGDPDAKVEKTTWDQSTVWIDKAHSTGFSGIQEDVWNFQIGGYGVCEKWLKDRKGRRLSKDDVTQYQRIVVALSETIRLMRQVDEVIDAHGGWPGAFHAARAKAASAAGLPFTRVEGPRPEDRFVTCLPLYTLKAAAGAFGDLQNLEVGEAPDWISVHARHRLRPGMFVAQVIGKSMEPMIPDGAHCVFASPLSGTLQGRTILVKLRDQNDPETGERFTVKRYESEKVPDDESWRHSRIILKPVNPDFKPIVLEGGEGDLQPLAEFIEVLGRPDSDGGT